MVWQRWLAPISRVQSAEAAVSQSAGRRTTESNRPVLFQADGRVSSGGCALGRRACYRSPAVVFVSVRGPVGLWIERERKRER
jgi:hypothetical protein